MRNDRGSDGYLEIGDVDRIGFEGNPDEGRRDDRERQSANKLKANFEQEVPASDKS